MQTQTETTARVRGSDFRVRTEKILVSTTERIQLLNLTPQVAERTRRSGIRLGMVMVHSLHTTLALLINEYQGALLDDMRHYLEQLVDRNNGWKHNNPRFSDCERGNADAHLRALLLGQSVTLPVVGGEPVLGTFQSVILAELDGPRERTLHLQFLGIPA